MANRPLELAPDHDGRTMPTPGQANRLAKAIAAEFRRRMAEEYVPRIAQCIDLLTEAEVWHRPSPHCNAIGNLLLHLEGNVRQWIQCGLGRQHDARDRAAEFDATTDRVGDSPTELVWRLRATVTEAVDIVDGLTPEQLLATTPYQNHFEETGVGAVLHVMEHFSGHAAQIYAHTKQLKAIDLRHYDL